MMINNAVVAKIKCCDLQGHMSVVVFPWQAEAHVWNKAALVSSYRCIMYAETGSFMINHLGCTADRPLGYGGYKTQ